MLEPVISKNMQLAHGVVDLLQRRGVREFCVCPGARNAPLVTLLAENSDGFKIYYHFEERSAAFFALGRIRQTGRPVAVVTTSGTAVGELLPAAMEAHYSGLPLVLLTADRPRLYRNSGAPQTAEQVGIFGVYVSQRFDLERGDVEWEQNVESQPAWAAPIHLNVCFDEPLVQGSIPRISPSLPGLLSPTPEKVSLEALDSVKRFFQSVRAPVVLVGMLSSEERESVAQALVRLNAPVYLEATSGLREDGRLQHLRMGMADRMLERARKAEYPVDGVIRFGGIPTPRVWRDLEEKDRHLPVLSLSGLRFSGLGRSSQLVTAPLEISCSVLGECLDGLSWRGDSGTFASWMNLDRDSSERLQKLLLAEPLSQQGWMSRLSQHIPDRSLVYLGNSCPIRDWDLVAPHHDRGLSVWASRGLNGIDGQVSTFLGYAEPKKQNWAILGDLTSLYDLAGPWILSQLQATYVQLVVVNNGGGKIFSRMFPQKEFQNQHAIQFQAWAQLWNLDYQLWNQIPDEGTLGSGVSRIIEIRPDEEATHRFFKGAAEL